MENVEIEQLVANIGNAAKAYSNTADLNGANSRTKIRAAARQLLLATMTPDEYCWEQVSHVSLDVCHLKDC